MYLLIRVGGYIGAWPTIGLVMLTAVVGVALLRIQGLATLTRGMGRLQDGELPAREMAEGILLAVAGALLITPGFVTDGFGFLLLLPPARAAVAERMLGRMVVMGEGDFGGGPRPGGRSHQPGGGSHQPGGRSHRPVIIEGEFESHSESGRGPEQDRDDADQRLP